MSRPLLYLLPGLLCDARIWAHQIAALGDVADIRVADLRGYRSIEDMAQGVLADAPPRFALAGHSMGGRVALQIVSAAPERVDRLALLDTGVHGPREEERESRGALVELGLAQGMAAVARKWLPPMVLAAHRADAALMAMLTDMVESMTPQVFADQTHALLTRPDATPQLGAIACPVMVGVGRDDLWSPVAQHEFIAGQIPGATLSIFEDSGHMAPAEAGAAVSAALRDWLLR